MDNKYIEETKKLSNCNLNTVIDNFQITVHNFQIENFERITGYETHRHTCYELHYIESGTGYVVIEGNILELEPGDLYIIAPLTSHKQVIYEKGMIEYTLRFDVKKLCAHGIDATLDNETGQIIELIRMSSNRIFKSVSDIKLLFEKAFQEAHFKAPGYFINIRQCITEMIIFCSRLSYKPNKDTQYELPSRSTELRQLRRITEYINENLHSRISNSDLAGCVHISERQLHRLIKNTLGQSPHHYVNQKRIIQAKELLDKKIYSLKKISEMTGFSSEFHLSSTFKKYEGISPSQYLDMSEDKMIQIFDVPDY